LGALSKACRLPDLTARNLAVATLSAPVRELMYELYEHYYEVTSRKQFLHDLEQKDWVVVLFDPDENLCGFTTLKLMEFEWKGRRVRAIFSGDTIVHHDYWGQQQLAFSWIRLAGQIRAQAPTIPLYWFLIVKGHRTYRLLQAFTCSYYPNWREPTPPHEQELMDHMATACFGDHYSIPGGIIRFPNSRGHLRPDWAAPDEVECQRPEVRFFLDRNPGYANGDEMVCLTELRPDNLRPLGRRLFRQGMQE